MLTFTLSRGELERRAVEAPALLGERCVVCPRGCKVDRRADVAGRCAIGRHAVVASYFPHFGEEDRLRGRSGSGTIFFSGCNLRCMSCQNHDISWQVRGERVTPERLAEMMIALQAIGCHNINWVTPEHVVPQILKALPVAFARGLRCRSSTTPAPTTRRTASAYWTGSSTCTCPTSRCGSARQRVGN